MRFLFSLFLLFQLSTAVFAQNSPKLQLLFMEMEHCPWCHKMNEEIFDNPKIRKKLDTMYIISKKLRDAENLPEFVKPRYYPTTYIISREGKLLDELPGYMNPARFLDYLTELYELETSGKQ